jgi:zinc protease
MQWLIRRSSTALAAAALFALLASVAPAQERAAPRVNRTVLENGLTVLVDEDRTTDLVALHTWVGVGSRDEDDETNGAAHFLEHMLFKGTARRRPGQMDREVEGLGGVQNAGTSLDWTYYFIVAAARHFDQILDLQSDAILNSVIDPVEVDRERRVVIEEINRRDNFPGTRALELLRGIAYTTHPYRRSVLGTRAGIERMSRETLLRFYRTFYVPGNMTVVVAGNVRAGDVVRKVRAAYAGARGGAAHRPARPVEPPIEGVRRVAVEQDVRVTYLALGFHAPAVGDRDVYATDVLLYALGRGLGARLRQQIVERARLAQSVSVSFLTAADPSLFVISAVTDPDLAERAEAAILTELGAVRDQGIADAELTRARNLLEGEHIYGTHTTRGRAFHLGFSATVADLEFAMTYLDRVRQVSAADLQRVARRLFDPQRYAVATIGPVRR